MARTTNKLTISVRPAKTTETVAFRATGHFGKLVLRIPPTYLHGSTLSPSTDEKAYWHDVLTKVDAAVLSM